jgi:two-component system, chemotaxis family, CheB/CheR fusion protein
MKPASGPSKKKIPSKPLKKAFPIVAIGASSGGLDAISLLLKNLKPDTGMAFIIVQHLSAEHKSFLPTILSKVTKMNVQEIDDMEQMLPDNIYVIPNNKGIKVSNKYIKLIPRSKTGLSVSIDILFSSLAKTHKENVMGVILSGNANDGTEGLKAIKAAGGITFAQDDSAQAGSMPASAIASGVVDFILSPKEIGRKLVHFSKNGLLLKSKIPKERNEKPDDPAELKNIFTILHKETGVDFSHYKTASIKRRLDHKMLQRGTKSIKEYAKLLQKQNKEAKGLSKDLLINVTAFFRDPETFLHLKNTVLLQLLRNKKEDNTLRIWVPACSTGQEAFSIAMILCELQETRSKKVPVQIFATDLSDQAIRHARQGEYSENDMRKVSKERISRFFTKTGDTYQISKKIREMCVFAPHNLLSDPPFFRIDFISCRNLLIYFDISAQKKVLATFHYALNDGGVLLLGKSETIGVSSPYFSQSHPRVKIYSRKKNGGKRKLPELLPRFRNTIQHPIKPSQAKNTSDSPELDEAINSYLLSHYMPACVIINKDMEILQFRGAASLYLSHPSGKASLNILKMMRPEFSFELRNAITKAIKTKKPVHKSGIEIQIASAYRMMSIEVNPLKADWDEPLLLVVFTFREQVEKYIESDKDRKHSSTLKDKKIKKLSEELSNARAEMHAVIQSQETAYEELQAANEEVVSTSEEFQTLNEELETSKEEIEASNEELITTNQELHLRNELLSESYNYSEAIIATIHEPMIILNEKLYVKSASKSFYKKFHTTKEATEGISFLKLGNKQWDIPELHSLLKDVVSKNTDFDNFEVKHTFPGIGEKIMLLNAHRILQKNHREQLTLLAIDDITERSRNYIREKEMLNRDIRYHKEDKEELEKAVKRRTRLIEQKNKELEIVNKELTTFTYISSHDLQEPLRKIQNFVTVIMKEEEKNLSQTGKEYFVRMKKTAKRMQSLIEDLLTYSRAKSGEQKFENKALNPVIAEVASDFEDAFHGKKAKIDVASLGSADILESQFRQVIHNLISNSIKFSKKKTPAHIRIKSKIVKGSSIKNDKIVAGKKYLNIIYTDNGIGFSPQYSERIFEVFQRLHSFDEYAGTGIGLAICKRIIENHHGLITAKGRLNRGARFDIYLPLD